MPRDGSGVYHRPVGTDAVPDTTIESAKYNVNVADVESDLNLPRPIVAGGTNATSADAALTALSAEKAKQVVTDFNIAVLVSGSFFAAISATNSPVSGHAFSGIVYLTDTNNMTIEARDSTDGSMWVRLMTAGVWGSWSRDNISGAAVRYDTAQALTAPQQAQARTNIGAATSDQTLAYKFNSATAFPPPSGTVCFNNATQNSTTELFLSHLNASGVDITAQLPFAILSGTSIRVQDTTNSGSYKVFTTTGLPVNSSGDLRVTVSYNSGGTDLVSGNSITAAVTSDGLVHYDRAQTLTAAQKAQARANIDVLKKNYIINGAMQISQENGATAGNVVAVGYFGADMFAGWFSGTTGIAGFQQVVSPTPGGSPNRVRLTVTAADAAVAAGDIVWISTKLEGLRVADLRFGSAAAKTVTLQFGVKAPAGTYSVVLINNAVNRSYVAEYVVAAGEANTDVIKNITIPGDTTGTWAVDNTIGIEIRWGLMAGTTWQQTAGSWGTVNAIGSPNQFNFMATNGNVFELFDVGLYEGSVAPPFMVPDYASELALCKRYWEQLYAVYQSYSVAGTAFSVISFPFKVEKRAAPTLAYAGGSLSNCAFNANGLSTRELVVTLNVTATGIFLLNYPVTTLNARL